MRLAERFPLATIEPRRLASVFWLGHIPFAAELIRRLRPEVLVELGTYTGSSLATFCQAAEESGVATRCYGVDLWEGDVHMGAFEESMYQEVSEYFASQHPTTAVLVRSLFDDAAPKFADGSVDLLHIDGTHTYEAVRNDYETWKPKLSKRGVVLFHDIHVTRRMVGDKANAFGVRRYFDSIKSDYLYAEFSHSYGLGVLCVGSEVPAAARELIEAVRRSRRARQYFAALGNELVYRYSGERPLTFGRWLVRGVKRRLQRLVSRVAL